MSDKKKYPFKAVSLEEWRAAASSEWKGEPPQLPDDAALFPILQKPYYDRLDLPAQGNFLTAGISNGSDDPRSWTNMPLIANGDDKENNELALKALNSGADGIIFEIPENSEPSILLNQIEFNYCTLSFIARNGDIAFFDRLEALAALRRYDVSGIHGSVFWKAFENCDPLIEKFSTWKNFRLAGLISHGEDHLSLQALAGLLARTVQFINRCVDKGQELKTVLNSLSYYVPSGADFFPSIAMLQAFRMLWQQIALSYSDGNITAPLIHVYSPAWITEEFEPHGNLLKSTTAAISAILGGCDALTILSEKNNDPTMERIALNVSTILREEGNFAKVANPMAGSYYLDKLTDQIAQEVWKKFQQAL